MTELRKPIFSSIYKTRFRNIDQLESAISDLPTAKDEGNAFEQLAYAYFIYHQPLYNIENIFMEHDIPDDIRKRLRLEKTDNGVDGVIETGSGELIAYQVKYRKDNKQPTYTDLSTFYAESEYADKRCIFSNAYSLPSQSAKKKNQFEILEDNLQSLNDDFFDWLYRFTNNQAEIEKKKFTPYPYQEKMINDVIAGFKTHSRGKLLAACAAGKTLTSLWIQERMDVNNILFVAPNLNLIKQTLESWTDQRIEPFSFICVCSDPTVVTKTTYDEYIDESIGIPVTTDSNDIRSFLLDKADEKKVVFSTYQSLNSVSEALKGTDFSFDVAFFDEAHRTAGTKDSKLFSVGMSDEMIPIKKRLFMTATERFVTPKIKSRAENLDYDIFSMDDENLYGPTFTQLSFREAIDQGIISDYEIIVCVMSEQETKDFIKNKQIVEIDYENVDANNLFHQVLLAKTMTDIGIHKAISYHRTIKNSKKFIAPSIGPRFSEVLISIDPELAQKKIFEGHIDGSMNAGNRKKVFSEFIKSDYGIITNARCLTEGVDVPIIDAVYFADPKSSLIDIIQAVGRSVRKDRNNPDKVSKIIVPIMVSKDVKKFSDIDPQEFSALHQIVQALRDQDRILADYIDKLNLNAATGGEKDTSGEDGPLSINVSESLDFNEFVDGIELRIAQVNKDSATIQKDFVIKAATRKSGVKRGNFKTMGDYTWKSYVGIIDKTLKKYPNLTCGLPREDIVIDNNNVSHCLRIGALEQKGSLFYVTEIGKEFFENPEISKDLFAEQCLKYSIQDKITKVPIFPYRIALKVIEELGYITKFEFCYSVWIIGFSSSSGIEEAIQRVREIRRLYPNIEILSETNKKLVLEELNDMYNTTLSYEDIWTSRTTIYNQFNYFCSHLKTIPGVFEPESESNTLKLCEGGKVKLADILRDSEQIETCPNDSLHKLFVRDNKFVRSEKPES